MKKFKIDPFSIFIWFWLFVFLGPIVALNYVLAILIHESGHYFVAKHFGYCLSNFSISSFGVGISYFNENINYKDEIFIALAGPIFNILSSFLILSVWWIFPSAYFFTESFVSISLCLALINLLPAYPLDGGRVFISLSSCFTDLKVAKKITYVLNYVFSSFFLFLFFLSLFINFNPTLLLFSSFLIFGALDLKTSSKYEKVNLFLKKEVQFSEVKFLIVKKESSLSDLIAKIQINKNYIFVLILDSGEIVFISEKQLFNYSLFYPYDFKLKNIYK